MIKTLFLDVGGVLLTNGWGRASRKLAAEKFGLDFAELDERHHLTFDSYEVGKLPLDGYLDRVIFHAPRDFTRDAFKAFMFSRSQPHPEMLALVGELKARHGLRVATISNEGRELTEHRIHAFQLDRLVDCFVSSSFAHLRKPDADLFHLAMDVAMCAPEDGAYVDDRELFVEVAAGLGLNAIHHVSVEETRRALARLGLD
ncbi:MAG: HAD hydrolase-like protein [Myxococcales bacterium]|nr:HAD hydrolase-like protein [Myxococcales bacterium]MCB9733432.1 HAD hydrolase-like protein [Deltaproteobacteria bacterium]